MHTWRARACVRVCDGWSTHVNAVAIFRFWSILKTTLVIDVVHDSRRNNWKDEIMFSWFIIQTVAPVTTVSPSDNKQTRSISHNVKMSPSFSTSCFTAAAYFKTKRQTVQLTHFQHSSASMSHDVQASLHVLRQTPLPWCSSTSPLVCDAQQRRQCLVCQILYVVLPSMVDAVFFFCYDDEHIPLFSNVWFSPSAYRGGRDGLLCSARTFICSNDVISFVLCSQYGTPSILL